MTLGDPTGIGPEILLKALTSAEIFQVCRPIVFGDEGVLSKEARHMGLEISIQSVGSIPEEGYEPGKVVLLPSSRLKADSLTYGQPDPSCGEAMVRFVEEAVRQLREGRLDALTTCPINKHALQKAGYPIPGHTELLAHLAGVSEVAMMFIGPKWRVVLVTTHLPLREVPKRITRDRLRSIFQLAHEGIERYFGIERPRMAVLGLNPHAGEEGVLGEEEEREILPAIVEAKAFGFQIEGPFPSDSFFGRPDSQAFEVVIAMYHDQGLIPVKMDGFKDLVHLTLGLPFVRTSVPHGTAYDIAGKGVADPSGLIRAIVMAARLSQRKEWQTESEGPPSKAPS
ncbi:MAG: 4-hydroxythreonine-4-phosphate dehydrogenase PdxA [Desulfobacterota bacterium]|nr:4-hydroxythreonine-4-phosphate dehydrogenase PdxA [Thermodesulfobacteriota bacterium]